MTTASPWAPLAALAVFLIEIVVFIGLGNVVGYPVAVLMLVLVSLVGLVLVRREGMRAWHGFNQAMQAGAQPGPQVTDGLVGLGGALLLAVPGLVTGLAGAALLTPPVRERARQRMQQRVERRMSGNEAAAAFGPRRVRVHHPRPAAADEPVIEGEIVPPDDEVRPGPDGHVPPGAAR